MPKVLVTGAAGFVGAALVQRLLADGFAVVAVDNINDYYDVSLKHARLKQNEQTAVGKSYRFEQLDIAKQAPLVALMVAERPNYVVHLAAQAGVRYGMVNQQVYTDSNLLGHFNMLAAVKALADAGSPVQHFLYASSSSVYGNQSKTPFEETDEVSTPLSLYASTKKANEMVGHAWANQFGLPSTALRFFTVYGPWGRPDMSPMLFAKAIMDGQPIPLFNGGDLWRDFTFVDDIVEAIVRLLPLAPMAKIPHRILNLGNQNPVWLDEYVQALAGALGRKALIDKREWPATEVYQTCASTQALFELTGWRPFTPLAEGLAAFAAWYKPMHGTFVV
jgi:UDP-glucuronate 4-epimerase